MFFIFHEILFLCLNLSDALFTSKSFIPVMSYDFLKISFYVYGIIKLNYMRFSKDTNFWYMSFLCLGEAIFTLIMY